MWSKQLESNKEIKELHQELKNKNNDIRSLCLEEVLLGTEVFGCKQKIEMLECNYDKLDRDFQKLDLSKSHNKEAEIQL